MHGMILATYTKHLYKVGTSPLSSLMPRPKEKGKGRVWLRREGIEGEVRGGSFEREKWKRGHVM